MIASFALMPAGPARGDWPVGRHDPQRTGAADGVSDIVAPETRWRYYLGGSLTSTGALAIEIDGYGQEEYVLAAGGALVARRFDDTVVWRMPPRDITGVVGASDLDGDGTAELVVAAARDVFVVDATTGAIEWQTPPDTIALLGGVRIADLDGDQLDDLLIVECGPCCSVTHNWPGAAYGFAAGTDQAVELWQRSELTCGQENSMTVFDADGDGDHEVLFGTYEFYQLVDGATGAELGRTGDLGTQIQFASCVPVDADGAPGDELACILRHEGFLADRSIFVLDWNGTSLQVLWRVFLASTASDELRTIELVVDLGSGPRVVVSTRDAIEAPWTTTLRDVATGAVVDTIPDALIAGTAPRPSGGRYLLTVDDVGLHGWRDGGGTLIPTWTRDNDEEPLFVIDREAAKRGSMTARAAVLPATGRLLVVPRSTADTVRALSLGDLAATREAELVLESDARVATGFLFPAVAERPFALARSDGFLTPLDEDLVPQLVSDDVQLPGLRTGGYYATGTFRQLAGPPRSADLDDDGLDEIVVGDSRGALVRLDPEHGSFSVPPRATWVIPETTAPTVTTGGDGTPVVACLERDTSESLVPRYWVTVRSPDAELIWTTMLPAVPLTDIVPGDFDGDAVPDLVVQWGATGNVLLWTTALAGTDGALLWDEVSDPGSGRAPAGMAVGNWPGEATDVILDVGAYHVSVWAGSSGALVAQSVPISHNYFLPMLADVDDDPAPEVALTGGFAPIGVLDDDLSIEWVSPDGQQRPYPYGSLARCEGGRAVLISQSWQYPARLTMTTISPVGLGEERTLWLAGGDAYATEAILEESGAWAGQLTSSTVHVDLAGAGDASALVGSSDGYLYVIDPCTGGFVRSVRFDAAVGEAVYGDTDGDGKDEILVTAGDGNLHALQNHSIDPPDVVYDIDVEIGGSADVDEIDEGTPLAARWDPVPGAIGYEAALLVRDDYATDPPWRAVTQPTIVFDDVEAAGGVFYRVAVRSISETGRSTDLASDGVSAGDGTGGGTPTGGCCDGGGGGSTGAVLAILFLLDTSRRRRARL